MIRWDYVLAGVAILLAIPSLFAPWYSGPQAIVVASAIAAIALLLAALVVQRNLNRPAISVRAQTTSVIFENDRTIARLVKSYEFRVHRKGLDHWVHRNISAEGQVSDFRWNGEIVPGGDIVKRSAYFQVTVRNRYAWPLDTTIRGELSYVLTDSFEEDVEYLQYVSDMPTQRARLRVEFPPNDQCTSAYLQRRENGVVETFEDGVERDPQGRWLEAAVKNPKGGQEYTVFWHW